MNFPKLEHACSNISLGRKSGHSQESSTPVDKMRRLQCFLLHFKTKKQKKWHYFWLSNLLFNIDQNAFSPLTYIKSLQFSPTEIGKFPDNFMALNKIHNFHTSRYATILVVLYPLHSFYTKIGKFPGNLYFWIRYEPFIRWIWAFLGTLKKTNR